MIVSLTLLHGQGRAPEIQAIGPAEIDYLGALESYARGDASTALSTLVDLESRWSTGSAVSGPESLSEIQLNVIKATLGDRRDALLPVIILHELAYLTYLERDLVPRALRSRATLFQLVELFAEQADGAPERALASDLFASLAGYFQETSSGPTGFELYDRSLELEPANPAALLGLAFAHERQGRYRRALRYLRRLVNARPDSFEGRLRLAINLDRSERTPEAIGHLETLIRQQPPEWILSLAYQELARWRHRQGSAAAARDLLERGLERLPSDPVLAIGSAYFDELEGLGGQEVDVAAALERSAGASGPPPRYRYSLHPRELLDRVREKLRAAADRSRGDLARALSARRPAGAD